MGATTSRQHRGASTIGGRERLLRSFVGSLVAGSLFATAFSLFFLSPTAYATVAACHLCMVPSSYLLETRWPGPPGHPSPLRYGVLGAALGGVVIVVLLQGWPPPGWAAFAIVVGAVSGTSGGWVASVLAVRWVVAAGVLAATLFAGVVTLSG